MTVQTDLLAAMKVFSARLDDANDRFKKTQNTAGAADYISKQTILLTDLSAALCTAVLAVADRLDALEK